MSHWCALWCIALCMGFKGCGRRTCNRTAVSHFLKGAAMAEFTSNFICPWSRPRLQREKAERANCFIGERGVFGITSSEGFGGKPAPGSLVTDIKPSPADLSRRFCRRWVQRRTGPAQPPSAWLASRAPRSP